ncbi:6-phosphogluconolactonase [Phycisphaera mikurensis]|uniref:6-phosphogluconolactonase n=1 Tax=Phycisphaera mikurensis (strain NBRC 102666 / KCTC 22515 / FYK2301M01) TaxID=1142394 RepID=I0IHA9_PHYMF|nr:6-phosphogluconolactonase [Phycisphaera mikurensis]MBB6440896.1 6-phosphogluconolactonase [Phycisphaera mikurensis]BAM04647.1 6-phosphogluconolactonase [Phycisphaera mikurensis NBRC 102666]
MKLSGRVIVQPDPEALHAALGRDLLDAATKSVNARGQFHLALSGGGTPEPFYERLATDLEFRSMPWAQTHVWVVDERRVPADHEKANIRMLRSALLDHVPTPGHQVHPMFVDGDDPAGRYADELADAYGHALPSAGGGGVPPKLDFVLLGMGGDCHTASLFPASPALGETEAWVAENDGEKVVPPPRITMTYPLLNNARRVAVLLTGSGKADALRRVEALHEAGTVDAEEVPISGIDPGKHGGTLAWYLDAAAAGSGGEER